MANDLEDASDDEGDGSHSDDADEDFEDLLPESTDEPIDGIKNSPEDWLEINGQRYLKASVVSQHLKANRSKNVVERTLRVGDLAATFVRTGSLVCLVVLQAIGINKDRQTRHVIGIETLRNPKEDYVVHGEVLHIVQASSNMWSWPSRDFLKVTEPKKSKHKKSAVRDFTLSVPGPLCYRINPEVHSVPQPSFSSLPDPDPPVQYHLTWVFCTDDLENLLHLMWADFQPEDPQDLNAKVKLLPQVWGSFPYMDDSGAAAFVAGAFLPEVLTMELGKKTKQHCPLCHEVKRLEELRGHIGLHILWRLFGVEEDLATKIEDNPCGFCGGNMCSTRLDTTTGKGKWQVNSNCRLRCRFKYGAAQKSTNHSPCTNIPIYCPHCSGTIWKYNAVSHIISRHKDLLDNASIDPDFVLDIQLGKDEEATMGIPNDIATKYHASYPHLFPREEDLNAMEVQGTKQPKKRASCAKTASQNKRQRR
ncbi:hypothetical protein BJ322DRAFT_1113247 [Thelephora terrestris]|uniref:Uncharacterized protein n=1 Tax=Thelephora terrestris TaxID=56493 RepID=A0A9P6L1P7_9AGAM|nr:hypothetical protein BJ322DRAFT_1113247 [Thelephora terrestris]